jgi:LemA protein
MIGFVVLGLGVVLLLWAVSIYNGLVRRRNIVAEAWSGIEAQLKRRADLIPNLVETVKGYAAHERTTFDELARLRSASQAGQDIAQRAQTEQKDLAEIEDQIQLARRYYNGAVRDYNVMIEQFPSNLIASSFAFSKAAFFQIENATDRDVPKVSFS